MPSNHVFEQGGWNGNPPSGWGKIMTGKLNAVDLLNREEMRYGQTACLQFKVVTVVLVSRR